MSQTDQTNDPHASVRHNPRNPLRTPMTFVGILIAFTFVMMITQKLTGAEPFRNIEEGAPIATRVLQFQFREADHLAVLDAADNATLRVYSPTEGGFIRGLLRGLNRNRVRHRATLEQPFKLGLWDNGHLVLEDPVSDKRILLNAFGPTNKAAFQALLPKSGDAS